MLAAAAAGKCIRLHICVLLLVCSRLLAGAAAFTAAISNVEPRRTTAGDSEYCTTVFDTVPRCPHEVYDS